MGIKTLSELRKSMSLTQEELAKIFGVTSRTIQNMEKDSTNIRYELVKKYMNFFAVGYDEIFLGNEYEKNVLMNKKKKKALTNFKEKQEV